METKFGNNQPGTPLGYLDQHGIERKLGVDDWRFPTDGGFELLYNVAKRSVGEIESFRKRLAAVNVNVTGAEIAQVESGTASLQTIMRERRTAAENLIALETLRTLAQFEHGLTHECSGYPARWAALANVQPYNPTLVVLDRWLIERLEAKSISERTAFMLEIEEGKHAATADALMRAPAEITNLAPEAFAKLVHTVAKRLAPEQAATLETMHVAADVSRAVWQAAVGHVLSSAPNLRRIEDVRPVMGDALTRYEHPPKLAESSWDAYALGAWVAQARVRREGAKGKAAA